MEVSKLESREVLTMMFGPPMMVTVIVLSSIVVGHIVTTRSNIPTQVSVSAASPTVELKPQVNVSPTPVQVTTPKVEVTVPQQAPPQVNVTTPPAIVTMVNKLQNGELRLEPSKEPVKLELPRVDPPKPPVSTPAKVVAPESPVIGPPVPLAPVTSEKKKETPKEEPKTLTVDDLYAAAEKYLEAYCKKSNLDPQKEKEAWNKKWKQRLDQAVTDNVASDEQGYINRVVVDKRDCFDIEQATPEKIAEGCRILLRHRDGKLAMLSALQEKVTPENIQKTISLLSASAK